MVHVIFLLVVGVQGSKHVWSQTFSFVKCTLLWVIASWAFNVIDSPCISFSFDGYQVIHMMPCENGIWDVSRVVNGPSLKLILSLSSSSSSSSFFFFFLDWSVAFATLPCSNLLDLLGNCNLKTWSFCSPSTPR